LIRGVDLYGPIWYVVKLPESTKFPAVVVPVRMLNGDSKSSA
jgi:hypothetical protein